MSWLATQVRDGQHDDLIILDCVDDSVWKAPQPIASDACPDRLPCMRPFNDLPNPCPELSEKLVS